MSPDEKAAAKAWKEYHKAIEEYNLGENNYNSFFAGFYAGMNYQKEKDTNK